MMGFQLIDNPKEGTAQSPVCPEGGALFRWKKFQTKAGPRSWMHIEIGAKAAQMGRMAGSSCPIAMLRGDGEDKNTLAFATGAPKMPFVLKARKRGGFFVTIRQGVAEQLFEPFEGVRIMHELRILKQGPGRPAFLVTPVLDFLK